ncbi:MAG: hypothetical protein QM664_15040 [Flavihumibacter sp.]
MICFFGCADAWAQGGYLYMETEPSRAFYVRTHDSLVLSSPGNFLILAPLRQWAGDIVVGFQGQSQPVFQFTVKDTLAEGSYLVKNATDGWRLIDVQKNQNVSIRRLGRDEQQLAHLQKRNDPFAYRLSQVVNDSSILYYQPALPGAVARAQTNTAGPPPVPVITAVAADSTPPAAGKPPVTSPAPPPAAEKKGGVLSVFSRKSNSEPAPAKKEEGSGVRRLFKTDMGSGWKLIYEVDDFGKKDTIEVNIIKTPVTQNKKGSRT